MDEPLLEPATVAAGDDTIATAEECSRDRPAEQGDTRAERESPLCKRLRMALSELAACRDLLQRSSIPFDAATFSCDPADHADVLGEVRQEEAVGDQSEARTGAAEPAVDSQLPVLEAVVEVQAFHEPALPRPDSSGSFEAPVPLTASETAPADAQSSEAPSGVALLGAIAAEIGSLPLAPAGSSAGDLVADIGVASEQALASASREKERLEVELSMAKALLMLNNVNINMDFDQEEAPAGSAAEVVKLKGSKNLIKLLLTLKQKVSLLNQQYLLLRGDMLYMNHEMNVCRHWILQSFRIAMQHQSQEHSTLQTRFERLSKVLT